MVLYGGRLAAVTWQLVWFSWFPTVACVFVFSPWVLRVADYPSNLFNFSSWPQIELIIRPLCDYKTHPSLTRSLWIMQPAGLIPCIRPASPRGEALWIQGHRYTASRCAYIVFLGKIWHRFLSMMRLCRLHWAHQGLRTRTEQSPLCSVCSPKPLVWPTTYVASRTEVLKQPVCSCLKNFNSINITY